MSAQRKSPAPRLVIIEGREKGKVIPLQNGTAIIGRTKGDVLIHDPRISRSHIAVSFDEDSGKLSFSDLKSLNGTLLNGRPEAAGELTDGDRLQIGNTVFDCQMVSQNTNRPPDHTQANSYQKVKEPKIDFEASPAEEPEPEKKSRRRSKGDKQLWKDYAKKLKTFVGERPKKEKIEIEEPVENEEPVSRRRNPESLVVKFNRLPPMAKLGIVGALTAIAMLILRGGGESDSQKSKALQADLETVQTLMKDRKLSDAAAKLEELKKKYAENSELYMAIGDFYLTQNKLEPALSAFEKAKLYPPSLPSVHVRLLQLYLLNKSTEAIGEEIKAVEKILNDGKPSKIFALELTNLFLDHRELKDLKSAMLPISRLLQTDYAPDSPLGYKLEAQIYLLDNKAREAVAALERGKTLDSSDEWILENLTFTKLALKDTQGAESVLDEWIRIKPSATKPLLILGYLRYNERNFAKALPYVQKVLQLGAVNPQDPQVPEALDLMGKLYVANQQSNEAINFFKQACEAGFTASCENPLLRSLSQQASPQPANEPPSGLPPPRAPKSQISNPSTNEPAVPPDAFGRVPQSQPPPAPPIVDRPIEPPGPEAPVPPPGDNSTIPEETPSN